jgi:hypothetical protein
MLVLSGGGYTRRPLMKEGRACYAYQFRKPLQVKSRLGEVVVETKLSTVPQCNASKRFGHFEYFLRLRRWQGL